MSRIVGHEQNNMSTHWSSMVFVIIQVYLPWAKLAFVNFEDPDSCKAYFAVFQNICILGDMATARGTGNKIHGDSCLRFTSIPTLLLIALIVNRCGSLPTSCRWTEKVVTRTWGRGGGAGEAGSAPPTHLLCTKEKESHTTGCQLKGSSCLGRGFVVRKPENPQL